MSSDLESKQSGKTILIPVDGSENSKRAFQCKYSSFALSLINNTGHVHVSKHDKSN